ncbi:MAG: TetR/AcrR family transcriptional regulator [Oscillospiraceae bacterium]|nr:TetR/AcrR family transcriptional regulator [Oscillospiraceae bacterium]
MTNRQLAAMETKKKLLEAAKKIVCEKGLINTSVEEITKACGVSNGTFYTYFKRKEDIVFALSKEMYQEIYEQAMAYEASLTERLSLYMTRFAEYIEKSSLKLCQEWVRNVVDPDIVKDGKDKLYADIGSIKGLLEYAVQNGDLKSDTPVDLLAETFADVLYGQMLCWDISGGAYSFEARTEKFCENFLGAIIEPYLLQ